MNNINSLLVILHGWRGRSISEYQPVSLSTSAPGAECPSTILETQVEVKGELLEQSLSQPPQSYHSPRTSAA